jgi:hypothetical protein
MDRPVRMTELKPREWIDNWAVDVGIVVGIDSIGKRRPVGRVALRPGWFFRSIKMRCHESLRPHRQKGGGDRR